VSCITIIIMLSDNLMIAATAAAIGASAAVLFTKMSKSTRPKGSSAPGKDSERRYLIAGNWKCNGTLSENKARIETFNSSGTIPSNVDVAICAPEIHLPMLLSIMRDDIAVGAQDCGRNPKQGAFTGETAAYQLKDMGCVWVIIGHSERRAGFGMAGESVQVCAEKCKTAIDAGLKVMFCIGEQKEERESGSTMCVCNDQLDPLVKVLDVKDWDSVAIAYEPVWAIGTGLTATPEMAQETHARIRKCMSDKVSPAVARAIRIQYGGSMKGANAKDLLAQPDIDGGLIGGASLTCDFFNVVNGVPM
jgi:triosephosphate isomerase